MNKEITIQIVLYEENINLIYKCLKNLKDFDIILVDNTQNEKLKIKIENNFQIFKYILNEKNQGFSKGHNQASQYCKSEYMFILNADCFIQKEEILNLLATIKKYKDCIIISPTTYDENSKLSHNGGFLPENGDRLTPLNLEGDTCVETVLGSSMLIKKKDFMDLKMFDENLFLFFSDDDLCRKAKNIKKSIIQSYHSKADHIHGQSKVKNKFKKIFLREYNMTFDELYYFYKIQKHYEIFKKLKRKIPTYIIKIILNLFLLRIEKSIYYFSKVLAFYKFKKIL
jgi:N-acetylglucosaminyl-diphospho-decaprenol L-rhamnosyltransferase